MMKNTYFIKNNTCLTTQYENLNTNLITANLVQALKKKDIIVSDLIITNNTNNLNLNTFVFYRTNRLKQYKLKCKFNLIKKNNVSKVTNLVKQKNISIKIINLNLLLDEKEVLKLFIKFKNYSNKLFNKRINLLCDLLKILSLIEMKKINIWSLVYLLSLVFKPLQKKKHGMFISFLNEVFYYLINNNKSIQGIKMIISGRLKGKPRGSTSKSTIGKLSLTEQKTTIRNAQTHIYTIYGCFGLKLWINYK
jgi:hypothetical protein